MPFLISAIGGQNLTYLQGRNLPDPKTNKVTLRGFTDWISKNQARAIGRFTFQNFAENCNFSWKYESLTPPRRIE